MSFFAHIMSSLALRAIIERTSLSNLETRNAHCFVIPEHMLKVLQVSVCD
jgi:hypothetical protein